MAAYEPQLPLLVSKPPTGEGWVHEIKYDGYRLGAHLDGRRVLLESRSKKDWTKAFPTVVESLLALGASSALLDGEVVFQNPDGTADFGALRSAAGTRDPRVLFYAFDLLALEGQDLRARPLLERKERLAQLLATKSGVVRFAGHFEGEGRLVFEAAKKLGAEGIVSKRATAPYHAGQRSSDWQKTKAVRHEDFLVGGYLVSVGAPLAALHLGVQQGDSLKYAGKVGTGFQSLTRELLEELRQRPTPACPFPPRSRPTGKDFREAHWTTPTLVVEVEFLSWAEDGRLRHPVFRRLSGSLAD